MKVAEPVPGDEPVRGHRPGLGYLGLKAEARANTSRHLDEEVHDLGAESMKAAGWTLAELRQVSCTHTIRYSRLNADWADSHVINIFYCTSPISNHLAVSDNSLSCFTHNAHSTPPPLQILLSFTMQSRSDCLGGVLITISGSVTILIILTVTAQTLRIAMSVEPHAL